jgi:hypothetical protein
LMSTLQSLVPYNVHETFNLKRPGNASSGSGSSSHSHATSEVIAMLMSMLSLYPKHRISSLSDDLLYSNAYSKLFHKFEISSRLNNNHHTTTNNHHNSGNSTKSDKEYYTDKLYKCTYSEIARYCILKQYIMKLRYSYIL